MHVDSILPYDAGSLEPTNFRHLRTHLCPDIRVPNVFLSFSPGFLFLLVGWMGFFATFVSSSETAACCYHVGSTCAPSPAKGGNPVSPARQPACIQYQTPR